MFFPLFLGGSLPYKKKMYVLCTFYVRFMYVFLHVTFFNMELVNIPYKLYVFRKKRTFEKCIIYTFLEKNVHLKNVHKTYIKRNYFFYRAGSSQSIPCFFSLELQAFHWYLSVEMRSRWSTDFKYLLSIFGNIHCISSKLCNNLRLT